MQSIRISTESNQREKRSIENKDTQEHCININNYCILTYTTTVFAVFEVSGIEDGPL